MKKKTETTKEHQPHATTDTKPRRSSDIENAAKNTSDDIIELILKDHVPLKELIQTLKDPELKRSEKEAPLEDFVTQLISHAKSEEKTLYVEMKEHKELRVESFEGDTEHAIADQLVHEINGTPDDDEWLAKVKVLAESVEHHIEEEEEVILAEAEGVIDSKTREALGREYNRIKGEIDMLSAGSMPLSRKRYQESRLN